MGFRKNVHSSPGTGTAGNARRQNPNSQPRPFPHFAGQPESQFTTSPLPPFCRPAESQFTTSPLPPFGAFSAVLGRPTPRTSRLPENKLRLKLEVVHRRWPTGNHRPPECFFRTRRNLPRADSYSTTRGMASVYSASGNQPFSFFSSQNLFLSKRILRSKLFSG